MINHQKNLLLLHIQKRIENKIEKTFLLLLKLRIFIQKKVRLKKS